jgi:hypothetical protein
MPWVRVNSTLSSCLELKFVTIIEVCTKCLRMEKCGSTTYYHTTYYRTKDYLIIFFSHFAKYEGYQNSQKTNVYRFFFLLHWHFYRSPFKRQNYLYRVQGHCDFFPMTICLKTTLSTGYCSYTVTCNFLPLKGLKTFK